MPTNQKKVYRSTGLSTRSNAKLEQRCKRATTVHAKVSYSNLCDNMEDKTKIEQSEKTKSYLMKMFPYKHIRRNLRSLILDSTAQRTTIMMEKLGAWKNTIVECDPKVAKFHINTGMKTVVGKLEDVISTRTERYNFVGADSETGPVGMFKFFHNFIENERYADNCVLHLNVSGHAGYGNKGETHEKFRNDIERVIQNNTHKCDIVLQDYKAYPCHRDNKITRGAPMYNYWYIITRK